MNFFGFGFNMLYFFWQHFSSSINYKGHAYQKTVRMKPKILIRTSLYLLLAYSVF